MINNKTVNFEISSELLVSKPDKTSHLKMFTTYNSSAKTAELVK